MMKQVEQLESVYRKCAEAYRVASEVGDAKAKEKNFHKLVSMSRQLRARGNEGEAALHRLMKDPSDAVLTWAAWQSLPFAEKEALKLLDAVSRKRGPIAFDAEMIAEAWRAGELDI